MLSNILLEVMLGNLLTLLIIGILYLLYQIVEPYFMVCLYALLFSEALQRPKRFLLAKTGDWLGPYPTSLLLLGAMGVGAVVVTAILTALSVQDMLAAGKALQEVVADTSAEEQLSRLGVNASTLQTWGVPQLLNRTMEQVEGLEAQYNATPWWPIVAETVSAIRSSMEVDERLAHVQTSNLPNTTALKLHAQELWSRLATMDGDIQAHFLELWPVLQQFRAEALRAAVYLLRAGGLSLSVCWSVTYSMTNLVFFVSLTVTLLASERSLLHELVTGFCGPNQGWVVEGRLRVVFEGVFVFPVAHYSLRYIYTLLCCLALNSIPMGTRLPFPFLLALLTFGQTLVPGVSAYPWLAALPWFSHLVLSGFWEREDADRIATGLDVPLLLQRWPLGAEWYTLVQQTGQSPVLWTWAKAAFLLLSQAILLGVVEERAARWTVSILPSWVTGLSVVCGFERFGLQSFFLSPLVVSLGVVLFFLITELALGSGEVADAADEAEDQEDDLTGKAAAAAAAGPAAQPAEEAAAGGSQGRAAAAAGGQAGQTQLPRLPRTASRDRAFGGGGASPPRRRGRPSVRSVRRDSSIPMQLGERTREVLNRAFTTSAMSCSRAPG